MTRLLLTALLFSPFLATGQVDFDVDQSVKMTAHATTQNISVTWRADPRTIRYELYRRRYNAPSWGEKIGTFPPDSTRYLDSDVTPNTLYEYKVEKFAEGVAGYGYVLSGFAIPPVHEAGRLLIVTTPAVAAALEPDLTDYQQTLDAAGWPNQLLTIAPDAPVSQIKAAILAQQPSFGATAVLLLGDVPVAFSGDINPDAHDDHKGAWPADLYYGDLDGNWTDTLVNNTTAATPVNHNVPGDEKWDQSFLPSDIELAVGRVDFSNLSVFPIGEEELLRAYLRKNIGFRTQGFTLPQRAAMRNSNPWIGALGQNGIRNFSPLVGPENITYGIWRSNRALAPGSIGVISELPNAYERLKR
ncbi:MAG: hypothetical protein AAF597_13345, partial [Bacteroidota bacterium]